MADDVFSCLGFDFFRTPNRFLKVLAFTVHADCYELSFMELVVHDILKHAVCQAVNTWGKRKNTGN